LKSLLYNKFYIIFLIPFLLGIITVFSFSPYNLTFINFFSFSSLLFLIYWVKKRTTLKYRNKTFNRYFFYLGSSFGFGFFLFGNYWISISLTHDEDFKNLIPFAILLIPIFLSLFFGLAILVAGPFSEKNISFILIFSTAFSLFEFLRGNILTGFPWNLISYTWSWSNETIQILSFIGTYAFSLISITFFCTPFILFQKKIFKRNFTFSLFLLFLFISNYLYGSYKIKENIYSYDEDINIKIVSPNFSIKNYNEKSELSQLKRLIKISDPEKNKKTIFIWPEGIFYESDLHSIKKYKKIFNDKFSKNHLIVLGINNYQFLDNLQKKKYFNSLVILNSDLEVLSLYNKINLVPFGEFLPFNKFFSKYGFKKITQGYNSFSSGDKRNLINLGNEFKEKIVLPLICYEIIYSGKIKTKNQYPDLVINISEDAWFGKSMGPYQHFSKAIYRSVEDGVFIARSANKGISAIIDPSGKVIKSLYTEESGNIEFNFPYYYKETFFSNFGNKIFALIILFYIFLILILKKFKI
jgi:apolipoprotein N-acyltransferase